MKKMNIIIGSLLTLSFVAHAETKHDEHSAVIFLDKKIEGHIQAARDNLRRLDENFKLYQSLDAELISKWAENVNKNVNEARYYLKAVAKGKASNKSDRAEFKKHAAEVNAIEAKAHSFARCSHLTQAEQSKSDSELLTHLAKHAESDKNFRSYKGFSDRCSKQIKNSSALLLKALNNKANNEAFKKDLKLKANLEAQAIAAQKEAVAAK